MQHLLALLVLIGISAAHNVPTPSATPSATPVPRVTEEPMSLEELHQNIQENCSIFEKEEAKEAKVKDSGKIIKEELNPKKEDKEYDTEHDINKR